MNMRKPILLSALLATLAVPALADNDSIVCNAPDQTKWMSQDAAKAAALKLGFSDIRKVKTSAGNCFEIYAISASGEKKEVFMDPVTGEIVGED